MNYWMINVNSFFFQVEKVAMTQFVLKKHEKCLTHGDMISDTLTQCK